MSKLKNLTDKIILIRKTRKEFRKQMEQVDIHIDQYNHIERLDQQAQNDLYDAVHDLQEYITEVTGLSGDEFTETLKSHGYVIGNNLELPKCLQKSIQK